MRCTRTLQSLFAAAALAMPFDIADLNDEGHASLYENGAMNDMQQIAATACRAGVCQAVRLDLVSALPEPPVFGLLAAGLALVLARGRGGFRLPVRRRPG